MGVIVARLGAIEEMAGMDMLCSDKTGTLTQNKLKLYEPIIVSNVTSKELVFYAALAAKRMEEGQDAIDFCITRDCEADPEFAKKLDEYEEVRKEEGRARPTRACTKIHASEEQQYTRIHSSEDHQRTRIHSSED